MRSAPTGWRWGRSWAPGRKPDLYRWWGDRVSGLLAEDLAESGSDVIVNLASKEYWHVVEQAPPKGARIVTIDFREEGPDGLRFNSFAAKRARGHDGALDVRAPHRRRRRTCAASTATATASSREGSDEAVWRFVRER